MKTFSILALLFLFQIVIALKSKNEWLQQVEISKYPPTSQSLKAELQSTDVTDTMVMTTFSQKPDNYSNTEIPKNICFWKISNQLVLLLDILY